MQLATGTLVVTSGAGQVVVVQPLPALAADARCTTPPARWSCCSACRSSVVHCCRTLAGLGVHEETPTGPVVIGAGQVVVVKLLPAAATAGVQLATGTLVVMIGAGQVIVV